ncbi:hypothetical protein ACM39_13820 [Chryseobacterium sp. FH2]|uniref:hypothetical protein n=1 Tax=Chryseobacterium sp. FH2 TaxID=1674291 RepID=UPI00065A9FC6|nr:hypothetical protein [Chryseobacterium sp. FH2]KMQ67509.1 hypothetical protein ACM39_13820 [Chryseobacterium sp. FH2]
MRTIYFSILLFVNVLFSAQDRLLFIKNNEVQKEVEKSVEYLSKTNIIPIEIKNKVVFITFDFDDIFDEAQAEIMGINYSTYLPTKYSVLNADGQFTTDSQNKIKYFNYSQNIVFVFFKGDRFFDQDLMKQLSNKVQISEESFTKSEYFKYEKGNEVTLDAVENFISLEKKDNKFIPVRVNTFDLKTFMEVWYGLDVNEIPVGESRQYSAKSKLLKKKTINNFHTHLNNK